ncbi:hypothetical protein GO306_02083 [Ralstonia solanacearum]|nr:hypothetical protein [Ralstonia solanacearum]NKA48799.1 hypothetical protein [Ralstonia solanacearum]
MRGRVAFAQHRNMSRVGLLQKPGQRRNIVDAGQGQSDQGQFGVRMRGEILEKGFVRLHADDLGNRRQGLQDMSCPGTDQGMCFHYD